jgi:hypothetical protein
MASSLRCDAGMGQWHWKVLGGVATVAIAAGVVRRLATAEPPADDPMPQPSPAEAPTPLAVAEEAYVYGYPMMVVDQTRQSLKGITNRFGYLASPPTAADKTVVRPNVDTLYSSAFLDLSAEPVVVHVPNTEGRYYVMQMMDANTNVFAAPGKRTTGTAAHDFVVIGPGWRKAMSLGMTMTSIRSPTNTVWIINRIQLNGDKDVEPVNALQKQFATARFSEWPGGATPAAPMPEPAMGEKPPAVVAAMDGPSYFNKLAILLRDNPPPAADASILQRFATIGLVPGKAFNPSPDLALTVNKAKDRALEMIRAKVPTLGEDVNGWRILTKGIGTYGTDYLQRAAVTEFGLGANLPVDAVYPSASDDASGEPLVGDKPYVLHFNKNELPPVNAFWSLTMYDKDGFFVENPLQRYAARDSLLKKNPDGSVDVYLQANSPGKDREANWLPAPKDAPFTLLLRMYWPKAPVLDGSYRPPGVVAAANNR